MQPKFLVWSSVLVVSLILTGLCIRALAMEGVSLGSNLLTRGLACLALVVLFARARRLSLRPRSVRQQLVRALVAGLALTFFTLSYSYLTASAVSVLSNIDVPLLLVLGAWVGIRASLRTRILALASIVFLMIFVAALEAQPNLSLGLGSLTLGTTLLCFGYRFIQKTMREENEAITVLVPSLSIIAYGLFEKVRADAPAETWTVQLAGVALLSGVGMFFAYHATIRLYELADLASAEFPTLLSSVLIQPVEAVFLGAPLEAIYLISSVGFVGSTYLVLRFHAQRQEPVHA